MLSGRAWDAQPRARPTEPVRPRSPAAGRDPGDLALLLEPSRRAGQRDAMSRLPGTPPESGHLLPGMLRQMTTAWQFRMNRSPRRSVPLRSGRPPSPGRSLPCPSDLEPSARTGCLIRRPRGCLCGYAIDHRRDRRRPRLQPEDPNEPGEVSDAGPGSQGDKYPEVGATLLRYTSRPSLQRRLLVQQGW